MFFQEPQETQHDLRFTVIGIPVRVHPMFWLLVGIFGLMGAGTPSGSKFIVSILTWVFVVFISILAHELGHALSSRYFGSRNVRIALYGFGGLTIGGTEKTHLQRGLTVAAGPGVSLTIGIPFVVIFLMSLFGMIEINNYFLAEFVWYMSFVNFGWAILNLIPVYPLDGGQICAEIVTSRKPYDGMVLVHQISIAAAVLGGLGLSALFFILFRDVPIFILFLYGYLGFMNYQMMNRPPPGRWH